MKINIDFLSSFKLFLFKGENKVMKLLIIVFICFTFSYSKGIVIKEVKPTNVIWNYDDTVFELILKNNFRIFDIKSTNGYWLSIPKLGDTVIINWFTEDLEIHKHI